jgi:(p)ppGpp synthase/HD superfamily hydrolase
MNCDEDVVGRARDFAKERHGKQVDDCGKPYFESHVEKVAAILNLITDDKNLLAAAYLHDTVEDTQTTYEELSKTFGVDIADLVMEVTHEGSKENGGYYFPRLKSRGGILLKFADRLSNLSRMDAWSEQRKEHYLKKSRFWREQIQEKVK